MPSDYNIFFKVAPYRTVIINNDIGKFGYDSMQQRTKKTKFKKSTSLRTFKVKFLTLTCLYFTKTCFVAGEVYFHAMM